MYKFDSIKPVLCMQRQTNGGGSSTTTNNVDTLGFAGGLCVFNIIFDQLVSAGPNIAICRLEESDDASTWAVVPGCDTLSDVQADGSSNEGVLAPDEDNTLMTFYIPLAPPRKRYIRALIQNSTTNNASYSAIAHLFGEGVATSPADDVSSAQATSGDAVPQIFRATA